MAFTEALPAKQRHEVEELLVSIMEAGSPGFDLTADELAEVRRRLADPDPEYVDPAEIDALLARDDD